jgi:copper chaperone CopZ
MKKIFLAFTFILSSAAWGTGKDIKVTVNGMVCGFCAQGISKKFKARPEIENVNVSLEKKLVVLKTKDGKDIADKDISNILTESGYTTEKIER